MKVILETTVDLEPIVNENQTINEVEFIGLIKQLKLMELADVMDDEKVNGMYTFLAKIRDDFMAFKKAGDTQLDYKRGQCYGCSPDIIAHQFIGNNSRKRTAFTFSYDNNNELTGVNKCYYYGSIGGGKPDINDPEDYINEHDRKIGGILI